MNRIRFVIAMLLLALAASPTATLAAARAADTPSQQALQRAAALFGAGDWKAAYAAYDSLATRYPKHALSRFRAGAALLGLGRAAQAEAMLREGERLGMPAPQSGYRLAQALAELRRPEAAVAELRRAYSGGSGLGLAIVRFPSGAGVMPLG